MADHLAATTTSLQVGSRELVEPVLKRVLTMILAQTDHPLDQVRSLVKQSVATTQLLMPYALNDQLTVTIECSGSKVDISFGPLHPGTTSALSRELSTLAPTAVQHPRPNDPPAEFIRLSFSY